MLDGRVLIVITAGLGFGVALLLSATFQHCGDGSWVGEAWARWLSLSVVACISALALGLGLAVVRAPRADYVTGLVVVPLLIVLGFMLGAQVACDPSEVSSTWSSWLLTGVVCGVGTAFGLGVGAAIGVGTRSSRR